MVAFNAATDLPSTVNTVEKLIVWSNSLMADIFRDVAVVEGVNQTERVFNTNIFHITATDPSQHRVITRASIEVASNWRRVGKLWLAAQDVGTIAIPAEYKS